MTEHWGIAEVARRGGVTTRTLRHDDRIGLLPAARDAGNGHRRYDAPALVRLRRIMLLRQLGLGLPEIASVLDCETDERRALRAHLAQALAERRLAWLAAAPGAPEGDVRGSVLTLADMYVADPRFAANYGGPAGAELVRAALRHRLDHQSD